MDDTSVGITDDSDVADACEASEFLYMRVVGFDFCKVTVDHVDCFFWPFVEKERCQLVYKKRLVYDGYKTFKMIFIGRGASYDLLFES